MDNRHLQDLEIERLADDDAGAETAALLAHVGECNACRVALAQARALTYALATLPQLSPAPGFANHVMARTRIVVPWHIAARAALDRATGFIPAVRWTAALGTSTLGAALAALVIFFAPRSDAVLFASEMGFEWFWLEAVAGARDAAQMILGAPAMGAINQAGTAGVSVAVASLLVTTLGAMAGLRALAVASHRARR